MQKDTFASPQGAPAVGPYSPAVRAGQLVFLSGQIPLDPDGRVTGPTPREQATKALENLRVTLEAAGASMSDVVKTTIYLTDLSDFGVVNEVYGEFFSEPYPARSTVQVARLPKDVRVEIEAIAIV